MFFKVVFNAPITLLVKSFRDPYNPEIVAEKKIIRGGDGEMSICGGEGFFLGWLPLASAYFDAQLNEMVDEDLSNCYMRRKIVID